MTEHTAIPVPLAPHGAPVLARGLHHLALNTDDMKMTIDFLAAVPTPQFDARCR